MKHAERSILTYLVNVDTRINFHVIIQNITANRSNNCSRNIKWFNLPYDNSVEIKVGESLKLAKKRFIKNHRYHKIFNKNNLKISYSCMKNMQSIITQHISRVIRKEKPRIRTCDCRNF